MGMEHAMDILGDLSANVTISPYSSNGERALDKMFYARLLPIIKPGACLEPRQSPPQTWDFAEISAISITSVCKSPEKHREINKASK
jgi:hypothetical protein